MSHPWKDELLVALSAVRKASEICQAVQSAITPEVLDKKDNSPVTIADFASQAAICHILGEAFPNDPENEPFLREICNLIGQHGFRASGAEICDWIDRGGAKEYCNRFWTLDPIDGTKGFLRRDQYAVSLALIVDGKLELGILACPNLTENGLAKHSLYYAIRGHGSFGTQLDANSESEPIHVSKTVEPGQSRFCESYESGHSSHNESELIAERLGLTSPPLRLDSQAKYAMVASGTADFYMRLPTKPGYFEKIWDHAGGVLVVQEAGGQVTDLFGKSLDFSLGRELRQNRGVIVSNGSLHEAILTAAQQVVAMKSSGG
jgi:3'(2'), 5'-bisphosphate nucleotidase